MNAEKQKKRTKWNPSASEFVAEPAGAEQTYKTFKTQRRKDAKVLMGFFTLRLSVFAFNKGLGFLFLNQQTTNCLMRERRKVFICGKNTELGYK
jgi:hypothetical protein